MKNAHNRSVEFSTILQTLITSTKLLQEASEEASVAVPSGPLVGVAIDRLETIKVCKPIPFLILNAPPTLICDL